MTWQLEQTINTNDIRETVTHFSRDGSHFLHVEGFSSPFNIQVWKYDGNSWVVKGSPISSSNVYYNGDTALGRMAGANINGDGSRLVVRTSELIVIYDWDGSNWNVSLTYNHGSASFSNDKYYHKYIDINYDGTIIACSFGDMAPQARVYSYDGTSLTQIGGDFNDFGRYTVCLNNAGTIIGLSSLEESIVFERDESKTTSSSNINDANYGPIGWTKRGDVFRFQGVCTYSIETDATGNRIVVGDECSEVNGNYNGEIRVFDWNGTSWDQVGQTVYGLYPDGFYGWNTTITQDGTKIGSGSYYSDPAVATLYQFNGTQWEQYGQNIPEQSPRTSVYGMGNIVSLNNDGSRVAVSDDYSTYIFQFVVASSNVDILFTNHLDESIIASSLLIPVSSPQLTGIDATVIISDVSATYLQNTFYFKTDAPIATELTDDVHCYVNTDGWPSMLTDLNAMNGTISVAQGAFVDNDVISKDFLRNVAQGLFGTHLGVDLFTNETTIRENLEVQTETLATNIKGQITDVGIGGKNQYLVTDTSGNKYFPDPPTDGSPGPGTQDVTRALLLQFLQHAPGRFSDLETQYQIENKPGFYKIPFLAGDSVSYAVTIHPHNEQNSNVNTGTNAIQRKYRVKLILV